MDFKKICWLRETDIALLNQHLIESQTPSEPVGILSMSGLSSAQHRAIQYQHYTNAEDVFQLGAVFAESLVQNHPFFNANKRTAAAAVMVFLLLNGWRLRAPWEQVVDFFEALAKHEHDIDDFQCWLAHWSERFDVRVIDELADAAYKNNDTIKKNFSKI